MVCLVVVLVLAGCSGDDDPAAATSDAAGVAESASVDRRPAILAEMGAPDSFSVSADEVDGEPVRLESWRYHEEATQIDFVDGEILWSIELERIPDGSLYPLRYEPAQFELLASAAEVRDVLPGVELTTIDLDDETIPDGVMLAGEQLLLGFVDDQLIYVEAVPLAAEATP